MPGTNGEMSCTSTDDIVTRRVNYYPALVDGIHGVNVKADGTGFVSSWSSGTKLKRGDLVMSNASYSIVATKNGDTYTIKRPTFNADLNGDDDKEDIFDGSNEYNMTGRRCVEA